tara:strand:- start:486 stop:779 length:294 start_codon:yes stop_codon:yes gene_type:complete
MQEDPFEELAEVYAEVRDLEVDFKKTLGMCTHLLSHSRELLNSNQENMTDLEQLRHEHQLMVNESNLHSSVIQQNEMDYEKNQKHQNEAESTIKALK